MTKKDYELAAKIVGERLAKTNDVSDLHVPLAIENAFVEFFLKAGGKFDQLRFRQACNKNSK